MANDPTALPSRGVEFALLLVAPDGSVLRHITLDGSERHVLESDGNESDDSTVAAARAVTANAGHVIPTEPPPATAAGTAIQSASPTLGPTPQEGSPNAVVRTEPSSSSSVPSPMELLETSQQREGPVELTDATRVPPSPPFDSADPSSAGPGIAGDPASAEPSSAGQPSSLGEPKSAGPNHAGEPSSAGQPSSLGEPKSAGPNHAGPALAVPPNLTTLAPALPTARGPVEIETSTPPLGSPRAGPQKLAVAIDSLAPDAADVASRREPSQRVVRRTSRSRLVGWVAALLLAGLGLGLAWRHHVFPPQAWFKGTGPSRNAHAAVGQEPAKAPPPPTHAAPTASFPTASPPFASPPFASASLASPPLASASLASAPLACVPPACVPPPSGTAPAIESAEPRPLPSSAEESASVPVPPHPRGARTLAAKPGSPALKAKK